MTTPPVDFIPSDVPDEKSLEGFGLFLSGGGYRAMVFHVGALWPHGALRTKPMRLPLARSE
jgi:NTE family protein